jgi:hypothetical protein
MQFVGARDVFQLLRQVDRVKRLAGSGDRTAGADLRLRARSRVESADDLAGLAGDEVIFMATS